MPRTAAVVTLAGLVVALSSCGTSTDPAAGASTTEPREWSGPPTLVTVHSGRLVAVDLADPSRVSELAELGELAASFGMTYGTFDDADLSPDGTTVVFTFSAHDAVTDEEGRVAEDRWAGGLYEVPADGSGEPVRLDEPGTPASGNPTYSPDGRHLALYDGAELVVIPAGGGTPASPGVAMPYPPSGLAWSPAGDRLIWVPQHGRAACCPHAWVQVDPSTGELAPDVEGQMADGHPYFDADGELRTQKDPDLPWPELDASHRYALSVSLGASGPVLRWWDTSDPDAVPRPLELDLDLPQREAVPVAW